MNAKMRKEHAELHKNLIDLLTDCENDEQYYQRLKWARDIITKCLDDFTDKDGYA